jgi:ParB-like chromosome segregation protein Spo0J
MNAASQTSTRATTKNKRTRPEPAPWPADRVERRAVAALVPSARNARVHSARQVGQIAASIKEWGWTIPVLIDEEGGIISGHGRVLAAQHIGLDEVPVMIATGWTEAQKRAYMLADNQLALGSTWNKQLLQIELSDLRKHFDLELMGFAAKDAATANGMAADELPPSLQLVPAREYALIMCADDAEWDRLKVALKLTPVRRGGYKQGSEFDDVGTQRIVLAADILPRLEDARSDPV